MKYFAKIDENNLVLNIDILNDTVAPDEATGNKGQGSTPGTVARVGGVWDEVNEGFWSLQPYPSWIKNNSTWQWEAPITYPTIKDLYSIFWDEDNLLWKATKFNDDPIITYTWNSTTLAWEDLN